MKQTLGYGIFAEEKLTKTKIDGRAHIYETEEKAKSFIDKKHRINTKQKIQPVKIIWGE